MPSSNSSRLDSAHPFCCPFFRNSVQNAGRKGLSILLVLVNGRMLFYMQFRACDASVEDRLPSLFARLPDEAQHQASSLATSWQLRISYCPCCGAALDKLRCANKKELQELARENLPLLLGR